MPSKLASSAMRLNAKLKPSTGAALVPPEVDGLHLKLVCVSVNLERGLESEGKMPQEVHAPVENEGAASKEYAVQKKDMLCRKEHSLQKDLQCKQRV